MSQFSNYGENKVADFIRGQGLTLPANWYIALASAASDSTFTELTVTGYTRVAVARSLTNFDSTQGDTLASTGTSHRTANSVAIDFGTPSGSDQTATHVGFFDLSTGGNNWIWLALANSITVGSSAPVAFEIGEISMLLGSTSGCSDYLSNKMIDKLFRAQSFDWPATIYLAAYTVEPTNAGGGTEVAAGDYSRPSIVPSLTSLSGTQSAGSTLASTGTGGVISNNAQVAYPTATTSWGSIVAEAIKDAATLGNLLFHNAITPKTIGAGAPLTHAAGTILITVA